MASRQQFSDLLLYPRTMVSEKKNLQANISLLCWYSNKFMQLSRANAFQNCIKTGSIINEGHIDLRNFLHDAKKMLIEKIQTTLKSEGSIKVSTTLICKFEN
ncbi:Protein of unknown function [Cotesia congregata]|uniref:Uncharacterized protein n=1 Tax=Cotesia congregata TaxID=51543 RepID=A0A8J2HAG0_COTCN|nr:Protein of unknown function [Cotesia congregata]